MNEQPDFPPMKPVRGDDVRQPRKPWWVIGNSRGYALFLGIFYPLLGGIFLVGWFVDGRWWSLLGGVVWILLGAAGWASYFWYRKAEMAGAKADRDDG